MHEHLWLGAMGVSVSLTLASVAGAEETGVEVGIRSGYAIPLGTIGGESKLNDAFAGVIPLWFDLGYRVTPNVMVGAYFQYGFGLVPGASADACDVADCSLSNMRLGLQVHYHFLPWEAVDPWVGGGIGYEWMRQSVSATVGNRTLGTELSLHGFEFLNLQAGVDFLPSEDSNFALGPFIALSLAEYSSGTFKLNGQEEGGGDVNDKGLHEWLTLGVRGTFVP